MVLTEMAPARHPAEAELLGFFTLCTLHDHLHQGLAIPSTLQEGEMKIRKQILDFEYTEVLDAKTRELIRVGCAAAVKCPT